jgi:hypothetical protein
LYNNLESDVRTLQQQMNYLLQAVAEFPKVMAAHHAALEEEQLRRRALRLALALVCGAIGRTQPQLLADIRATIGLLEEQFARNNMPESATQELQSLNMALSAEDAWPNVDQEAGQAWSKIGAAA